MGRSGFDAICTHLKFAVCFSKRLSHIAIRDLHLELSLWVVSAAPPHMSASRVGVIASGFELLASILEEFLIVDLKVARSTYETMRAECSERRIQCNTQ